MASTRSQRLSAVLFAQRLMMAVQQDMSPRSLQFAISDPMGEELLALEGPTVRPILFESSKEVVLARISSFAVRAVLLLVVLALTSHSAYAQTHRNPALHVRTKWQDFVGGRDGAKRLAS